MVIRADLPCESPDEATLKLLSLHRHVGSDNRDDVSPRLPRALSRLPLFRLRRVWSTGPVLK